MEFLLQDIAFAFRQLRKSPGFAALAVITLAFGIGANTAMFTVVESVMVRSLPYANADKMVYIGLAGTQGFSNSSYKDYRDVHDQSRNLAGVGVYSEDVGVVQTANGSVSVATPRMSPSMFQMLGAQPEIGRTFTNDEGTRGGPLAVILSDRLWRESFQGDPSILNKTVRINNIPAAVVGVMPRNFRFPESTGSDVDNCAWLVMQPTEEMEKDRGYDLFTIIATLKPGVSLAAETSELQAIGQRIRETDTHAGPKFGLYAANYQEMLTGPVGPVLLALMIALGLVLLIACANVANLLIARCLVRQHEFAVRSALGASGMRLARQLIVEGGALSVLGSALGFGLAWLAIALVHKLPSDTIPRSTEIAVRWTVVLALAGIASVTTILSALIPSFLVARSDPQKALQASSRGVGTRSVKGRLSGTVVAGEVALSALLLVATGLLFHTLWNLEHASLGFDVARVTSFMAMPSDAAGFANMTVSQDVEHAPPSVATTVYAPALERMRALPGVQDAALVTAPPLNGFDLGTSFDIVGQPHDREHEKHARITAVSGDYARLMGTPVIRGRMISSDDTANAPYVIAINEALANTYFAGKDPIGQQIDLNGPQKDTGMTKPYTIVGVIADQVDRSISVPPQPFLMVPYEQIPTTSLFYQALLKTVVNFVVKTKADIAVAPAVRSVFKEVAPGYALDNFQTMQEAVDKSNFSQRLGLYLTGAFAGLAVLMVIAGLYGVLGQLVSYRRREFGIRIALGATQGGILRMVLRQGLLFVGAGLAVGLVIAFFGGNLVGSFLYGVKPVDAWTYAGVVVALPLIGIFATLAPALKASSVEPMIALREE
jgi:putative ABC transport system permease protein